MGEKINNLEKDAIKLFHDNSEEALKLEQKFRDKGYNLKIVLSGSPKPILSCPGRYLSGYCQIERFID